MIKALEKQMRQGSQKAGKDHKETTQSDPTHEAFRGAEATFLASPLAVSRNSPGVV